jgi:hypothetical protein
MPFAGGLCSVATVVPSRGWGRYNDGQHRAEALSALAGPALVRSWGLEKGGS